MDYIRVKKAYEIDFNRIDEGYLWGQHISYAENRNKAKIELLPEVEGAIHNYTGEEITYINIPVVRCKQADKYDFNGEEMTLSEIEEFKCEAERLSKLDEILNNSHIKYCYIRKGPYYKPNNCGYTDYKYKAGVYTKEEAVKHAKGCRDIWLERIDIEDHNKMIESEIKYLKARIIK